MKNLRMSMIVSVVILASVVSATPANETVSVGRLVQELAAIRGVPSGSPAIARASLRDAGLELPDVDLDAPLTEGSVVQISDAFGVNVRTSHPEASFDADEMSQFLLALGSEFGNASPRRGDPSAEAAREKKDDDPPPEHDPPFSPGADPRTKGKGKKKGLHKRSPCGPGDH